MMAVVGILFTEAVGAAPDGVPGPFVGAVQHSCKTSVQHFCTRMWHVCLRACELHGAVPACQCH